MLQELQFLGPGFQDRPIDRVYNGIPAVEISTANKLSSRGLLQRYAEALLGVRPECDIYPCDPSSSEQGGMAGLAGAGASGWDVCL